MGQTLQQSSVNTFSLKKTHQTSKQLSIPFTQTIPFSITPQKALFNYIRPLSINQQHQLHINYIIETNGQIIQFNSQQQQQKQQKNDQNQQNKQNCHIKIRQKSIKSIKQIKVKWNSFIKMKQKDYLSDYEIIKKIIGKGGFGVVRKVKSKYTKNLRVAKCIQKKLLNKDDVTKLFTQLFIMKMLDHPNIIKLYEVYDFNDEYVLILQMCCGGEVLPTGKARRISEAKAAVIIKQLLRSLIYLHSQNIVHRDIKPQNMLFQNQDKKMVKLIDFGIAIKMKQGEILQDRIGTPSFVAPEIIYKQYNQKCDVWATGITMFQLISGRTPFQGDNQTQTMRQILRAQLQFKQPIWSKVSKQCKDVIKLMLNKKYEQRPSAKQIFENIYFTSIIQKNQPSSQYGDKSLAIQKMQSFAFKNKLQAVVRTYMASQLLTKQQKQVLVQVFKQFDTNSDGVICSQQLHEALAERRNISMSKIQSIMRVVDINGSGQIDYTQFLVANCQISLQFTRQRLKHVFKYFDSDHNGFISYTEVSQFLMDYQSTDDEIKKIFQIVDVNGDGCISEDQFIDLLIDKMYEFSRSFSVKVQEKIKNQQIKNDKDKQNVIVKKREQILIMNNQNDLLKIKKDNKAKRLSEINVSQVLKSFKKTNAKMFNNSKNNIDRFKCFAE